MESETLLIIIVLFCLLVLAVVIMLLISGRSKESTDYITPKIPITGMGETGIGETGSGVTDTGGNFTGSFDERLKKLIDQWRIIEAVKLVRETKNVGLKEARDYINNFMRGEESEGIVFESSEDEELTPDELDAEVYELLMKKQKIDAVKLVKENLNIGLKEAKDYVEEIEKKLNI